jgi:hypothetical protein
MVSIRCRNLLDAEHVSWGQAANRAVFARGCSLRRLAFCAAQYAYRVRVALFSQFSSRAHLSTATAEKYFTALALGLPSGFINLASTRTGMSWGMKPSTEEDSSPVSLAGKRDKLSSLKMSSRIAVMPYDCLRCPAEEHLAMSRSNSSRSYLTTRQFSRIGVRNPLCS